MSKVFAWHEIWPITRRAIPSIEDFHQTARDIREKLAQDGSIIGGILYGSAIWSTYSRRSDIDCIVLYWSEKRDSAFKTFREVSVLASDYDVPIDLYFVDTEIASASMHRITLSLTKHLEYAVNHGGLVRENPLPYLSFKPTSDEEEVVSYLSHKLGRLEREFAKISTIRMKGPEFYRFLQKVLEAPIHIARKMLWLEGVEMEDDSKDSVLHYYPSIASERELNLLKLVVKADRNYTRVLQSVLDEKLNHQQYSITLEELASVTALHSLEFARLNVLRLA
ncbi:MAG: nucleotidyltransferase domain-containing protein [bacterium]|nr:nucleotidyltransferase domain-containing protein [bacterium]